MRSIIVAMWALFFGSNLCAQIAIKAMHHEKMKIVLYSVGADENLIQIGSLVGQMLERSKAAKSGFALSYEKTAYIPPKNELKKWYEKGVPLAVVVSSSSAHVLEWRLFDTGGGTMIKGKRCSFAVYSVRTVAEHIADELWPLLTGQPGFFSTRIAYCKLVKRGKRMVKNIYITAPYCDVVHSDTQARLVVGDTNAFAPRWNNDHNNPMILYCQIGSFNVRLLAKSFDNCTQLVANFDGMTSCPSFSPDGKVVAYCAANGTVTGSAHIYLYTMSTNGKASLHQITDNNGNNVSPSLCPNGDIVFCSDYEGKQPAIYWYRAKSKVIERITPDGYCTAPSYCAQTDCIAYSKMSHGVNQLWMYSSKDQLHRQLTFDSGDKKESSWSPCGNYLVFVHENGIYSRIAVHHMMSNERIYLTAQQELCSYPTWSPFYRKPIPL